MLHISKYTASKVDFGFFVILLPPCHLCKVLFKCKNSTNMNTGHLWFNKARVFRKYKIKVCMTAFLCQAGNLMISPRIFSILSNLN